VCWTFAPHPVVKARCLVRLCKPDDLLVANEIIKTRVPILTDNLTKWGTSNIIASNNDPRDFNRLKGFFDVVLVDAPCSGSGMFRKDPDAMNEWSEARKPVPPKAGTDIGRYLPRH
jgi:16S rRNA C967 or C1407 C5-methylase (RsmB/RsmF family)